MNREIQTENYLNLLLDLSDKLNIDELLLNLLVEKAAKEEEINDQQIFLELSISICEVGYRDQNAMLKLKHRPEMIKRANESFEELSKSELETLREFERDIVAKLVTRDNADKPIKLHLEAVEIAKDMIEQAKEDYAVNSLQMLLDASLYPSCLEPLIKQFKLVNCQ